MIGATGLLTGFDTGAAGGAVIGTVVDGSFPGGFAAIDGAAGREVVVKSLEVRLCCWGTWNGRGMVEPGDMFVPTVGGMDAPG